MGDWGKVKTAMLERLKVLDLEQGLFQQFFMDPKTLNCVVDTHTGKFALYSPLWLELTGMKDRENEFEDMEFVSMVAPSDRAYTLEIWESSKKPESDGTHKIAANQYELHAGPFWVEWVNAVKSKATKEHPKGGRYMMCAALPIPYEKYIAWKRKNGLT